jgi:hypothetical protein
VSVTTLDSLDKVAAPWRHNTKENDSDTDDEGQKSADRPKDESEELPGEHNFFSLKYRYLCNKSLMNFSVLVPVLIQKITGT